MKYVKCIKLGNCAPIYTVGKIYVVGEDGKVSNDLEDDGRASKYSSSIATWQEVSKYEWELQENLIPNFKFDL